MIVWNYSIKDLERLSGVKAHTIRVWEQRYGLLIPNRTDTNIRSYDDDQLKKLLNICLLLDNGFKISKISEMDHAAIRKAILDLEENSTGEQRNKLYVEKLIQCTIDFNEEGFDQLFAHAVLKSGLEKTILEVIYPLLRKIGTLWGIDDIYPAQEHFVSQLIKKKLFVAIDGVFELKTENTNEKYTLLFLPQWEQHDIALLLSYYIIKKKGKKVLYLGPNVPFDNLKKMSSSQQIDELLTFFIQPQGEEHLNQYIKDLSESFPNQKIYFSGIHNKNINLNGISNVHALNSPSELEDLYDDAK